MKIFKVLLDETYLGESQVIPTTTIKDLKEYGMSIARHYQKNPSEYVTDIYTDPKTKLDLSLIDEKTILEPYWNYFTDPYLHILKTSAKPSVKTSVKTTNFLNLPPDMKRYLIDFVEPLQAMELCKTVKCNYDHLLNHNYDFVTQGFAPGNTAEEKFKYLAERVSRNSDFKNQTTDPEIIFLHFNGIPLGSKRFYNYSPRKDEEYTQFLKNRLIRERIERRVETMNAFIKNLSNHPAIEWLRQDEYNMWIKVKDRNSLPSEIYICTTNMVDPFDDRKMTTVFRNIDYDYPSIRFSEVEKLKKHEYPGTVKITPEVVKNMVTSLIKYIDIEDIDNANVESEVNEYMNEYVGDAGLYDITPEYVVYSMMLDGFSRSGGFSRSEGEIFTNIFSRPGSFSENLKQLYDIDVNTLLTAELLNSVVPFYQK